LTTYTLTIANGLTDQSRQKLYPFVGALTGDCTVTIPSVVKIGWALNATTGSHNVILKTAIGGGGTLTLAPGLGWVPFYCDGANVSSPVVGSTALTTLGVDAGGAGVRMIGGNYGSMLRNDGTSTYVLLTNSGSQTGAFNSLRPFTVANATGAVSIDSTGVGVGFGGSITVVSGIEAGVQIKGGGGYITRTGSGGTYGGNKYNINWTGSVAQLYIDNSFVGNFSFLSDRRIKKDIAAAPSGALDRVLRWNVVEYEHADVDIWKSDGVRHLGFVADELQAATPFAVTGTPGAVDEDGKIVPQTLQPIAMIAELAQALQELAAEFAAYRAAHP
jgi:hypothetical protein